MTTWLFYLNSWLYEVIWPPIVQQLPDPPLLPGRVRARFRAGVIVSEWNDAIRFAQQIIASQAGNLPAQTRATPAGTRTDTQTARFPPCYKINV